MDNKNKGILLFLYKANTEYLKTLLPCDISEDHLMNSMNEFVKNRAHYYRGNVDPWRVVRGLNKEFIDNYKLLPQQEGPHSSAFGEEDFYRNQLRLGDIYEDDGTLTMPNDISKINPIYRHRPPPIPFTKRVP